MGGFIDPQGVTRRRPDDHQSVSDPTRRGAAAPFQFYLGSFTFNGTTVGSTDIFLTINQTLMLGNAGMIGTTASPGAALRHGRHPLPVRLGWHDLHRRRHREQLGGRHDHRGART